MGFLWDKYELSRNQMFWGLQFVGWFGLALLTYMSLTLSFNQTELPYVLHPFVQSAIGIAVSWPLRGIFRYLWGKPMPVRLLMVVVAVFTFSFLWNYLRLVTFIWMTGTEMNFFDELIVWNFTGLLVFIGWVALYHGFRYYRLLQDEHESLLRIEREKQTERFKRKNAENLAKEAQLKMLQYQLNPHFLFNTMNAITSLISADRNREACKMIFALSSFLRNALQGDPLKRVTLRQEIQSLEDYLSIELVRFDKRLDVDICISEADPEFPIPGLILQPLAENVIKHAVRPTSGRVELTVKAKSAEGLLNVEVADDGPGIPCLEDGSLPKKGIGLKNIQNRLENMYGDRFVFRLSSDGGKGVTIHLQVPAERIALTEGPLEAVGANA